MGGAEPAADQTPRPSCPRCGVAGAWPIVYGLPGPDTWEWAGRNEVELGGCLVTPDNPTRACQACGHRWLHPGDEVWPED